MFIVELVPLLQTQRDLYAIPRGRERFDAYIETMVDSQTRDLELPLVGMNPMGKEHIPALLDRCLELDVEQAVAELLTTAAPRFNIQFRTGLVMVDDAQGGWTNRTSTEFTHLFETKPMHKRGWLVGHLWTSETPSVERAQAAVLSAVYRGHLIEQHGHPTTLREMLAQEGGVNTLLQAHGLWQSPLDVEEHAYSREIIDPLLDSEEYPVQIAAIFGDEAAHSLGYNLLGLSPRAGLAVAADYAIPAAVDALK